MVYKAMVQEGNLQKGDYEPNGRRSIFLQFQSQLPLPLPLQSLNPVVNPHPVVNPKDAVSNCSILHSFLPFYNQARIAVTKLHVPNSWCII